MKGDGSAAVRSRCDIISRVDVIQYNDVEVLLEGNAVPDRLADRVLQCGVMNIFFSRVTFPDMRTVSNVSLFSLFGDE